MVGVPPDLELGPTLRAAPAGGEEQRNARRRTEPAAGHGPKSCTAIGADRELRERADGGRGGTSMIGPGRGPYSSAMSEQRHRQGHLALVPPPAHGPDIDALTRAIADGELDPQLRVLRDAITARLGTLATRSTATALLELSPGDRVEINDTARPKYLHGARGTVAGLAGQHVIVTLDRPVGRFRSGQLRCHPLSLDRLASGP
jgi:hypothetical protein